MGRRRETRETKRRHLFLTDWSDDGPSQAGTGYLTFNPTLSGTGAKFFRIRVD